MNYKNEPKVCVCNPVFVVMCFLANHNNFWDQNGR